MSKAKQERETHEEAAMRHLEKQMDLLRERVVIIESKARNHARHLPNGETRLYVSYIRTLTDRLIAAFDAGAPIPHFGSTLGADEDD